MTTHTLAGDLFFYPISEYAVTIEFGKIINDGLVSRVNQFNELLLQNPFPGMYQTVPAYASLTVFYDPVMLIRDNLPGKSCHDKVYNYLQQLFAGYSPSTTTQEAVELITIPVCYGNKLGPDLGYLASYHETTADEVIGLHSSAIYKVYMIGFIPGFAYMGGLHEKLETPRKATPVKVPAGAVGIAGKQTGIYPLEIPGGWQIIGQTPLRLFNAERTPPTRLKAGDRVQFEPITLSEFENYSPA
jgi:inhibitor of KinA